MIALVVGLATAVAVEWPKAPRHCLQTSISAYYTQHGRRADVPLQPGRDQRKRVSTGRQAPSIRNRYATIATAMLASAVIIGIAPALGWDYWVIALESAFIALFAVFWIVQTIELWDDGLRRQPPGPPTGSDPRPPRQGREGGL
jgi:hypothetical protein